MKKVKLLRRLRGRTQGEPGDEVECDEKTAQALVACGAAEALEYEAAAIEPVRETATKGRGRKKKVRRGPETDNASDDDRSVND